jgi:hypothetical protein
MAVQTFDIWVTYTEDKVTASYMSLAGPLTQKQWFLLIVLLNY